MCSPSFCSLLWSAALSSLTCLFLLVELIQAFFHLLYCRSCFRLIHFKLGRGGEGGVYGLERSSDSNLFSRLETEEDICCSFFVHFYYLCENPIDFWPTVCRHSPKPSNISLTEESSSEQLSLIETSLTFFFSGERNLPSDKLEPLDPSLLFFLLPDISCFGQHSFVI